MPALKVLYQMAEDTLHSKHVRQASPQLALVRGHLKDLAGQSSERQTEAPAPDDLRRGVEDDWHTHSCSSKSGVVSICASAKRFVPRQIIDVLPRPVSWRELLMTGIL